MALDGAVFLSVISAQATVFNHSLQENIQDGTCNGV
jgi:hypothetical protein